MVSPFQSSVKTALVTGATGFIGRHLVKHLIENGWQVTITERPGSSSPRPPHVAGSIPFDLRDDAPVAVPKGIDTVFHLAGKAHALSEVAQDDAEYDRVNTIATRRLLEGAQRAGVHTFVFFSSVKAVGEKPEADGPIDETWDAAPETAYGRSKREAEKLVLEGGYLPHCVVLRPSLVYGPGAKGNLEKMEAAVRAGRFPSLSETGNRRSMVHVHDLCRAALAATANLAANGKVYIIADRCPVSTRQLFVWMCEAIGRPVPRWQVPAPLLRVMAWAGDVIGLLTRRRFVFDSSALAKLTGNAWYSFARIERELGWAPLRTLRGSLPEIVGGGSKVAVLPRTPGPVLYPRRPDTGWAALRPETYPGAALASPGRRVLRQEVHSRVR